MTSKRIIRCCCGCRCSGQRRKKNWWIKLLKRLDWQPQRQRISGSFVGQSKWLLHRCIFVSIINRSLPFDLVVVTAKQFRSAFKRQDIDQILVHFPKFNDAYYIRDVSSVFHTESGQERFFTYIIIVKKDNGEAIKIDALEFSNLLCRQLFTTEQPI